MTSVAEMKRWLCTLPADAFIAIDDGGLTAVALDANENVMDSHLDIGGIPKAEDDEMREDYLRRWSTPAGSPTGELGICS